MIVLITHFLLLLGLTVVFFVTKKQIYFLSPTNIFLLYSSICYPISYLVCVIGDFKSIFFQSAREINEVQLLIAALLYVISVLVFCCARFANFKISSLTHGSKNIVISKLRISILLCISVVIFAVASQKILVLLGGFESVISNIGAIRAGGLDGLGLYSYAVTMLVPTCAQLYLICKLQNNEKCRGTILLCTILSLSGGLFGFRGPVIALLIQLCVIVFYYTGKPTRSQLTFSLFVITPILTLAALIRYFSFDELSIIVSSKDLLELISNVTITRVRAFETFVILHEGLTFDNYGFYLSSIFETFRSIIPSQLIEKGPSVAQIIATENYSSFLYDAGIDMEIYGGVAYGYLAESFWNFGYIGVILFSGLLGFVLKYVEHNYNSNEKSIVFVIVNKTIAGFMILLIEAPQLGLNAIALGLFVNAVLVLSVVKYRF